MAKKKIGLSFFQLVPTGDLPTNQYKIAFNDISQKFLDAPSSTFEPLQRTDGNVNLYGEIEKKRGGYIMGTLVNSQMLDIPPSYDIETQKLAALNLGDSQGLGYPTSFLFDSKANILMIEVIRNGVGVNSFARFFQMNLDIPNFEPAIVINPVDLQKFYDMTTISKFHVKVAKVEQGSLLKGKHKKGLDQIMDSADGTNTNSLEYVLSAKRNESLTLNKVRGFVSAFLSYKDSEEVKTLKVTGKEDEDGPSFPLDLIQQRLRDSISVEKTRFVSSFSIKEKYSAMETIYAEHRQAVINAYQLK